MCTCDCELRVEYYVDHRKGEFFIVTNANSMNYKVCVLDYVHDNRTQSRYTVHCFLNTVHLILNCVHCVLNYIYCVLN